MNVEGERAKLQLRTAIQRELSDIKLGLAMSLRRVPAVLRDDSGIRLGVAACLVVLSLTLEGCATKPTPRSGGKGASPSQSATTSSASPAAWRLPTQFVVLTSTQQVPEVAAIIVHDAKQPQHPGGPNASYQLVAGLAAAVDTAQPKKESERIARAFEQLCQPGAPRVDVWVEGLVGLLVRYAIENIDASQNCIQRIALVNTPHRGLSPSGWERNSAGEPVPAYAVSGSSFLIELDQPRGLSDKKSVPEYFNVWRDVPDAPRRASAMRLIRRGARLIVGASHDRADLLSVLEAPVLAIQHLASANVDAPRGIGTLSSSPSPALHGVMADRNSQHASDSSWVTFTETQAPTASKDPLNRITDPVSIAFVPESCEILITGREDFTRSPLRSDVFWAAVRAFHRDDYPAVSIDPPPGRETDRAVVRYSGGTEDTSLGWTMFEADRVMKGLALGADNVSSEPLTSSVVKHSSVTATSAADTGGIGAETVWRLWFEPGRWSAREPDPLSAIVETEMSCKWERMTDAYAPSGGVADFTERLTRMYAAYAREQPSLDALDQHAALVAMAQWLVDSGLDVPDGFDPSSLTPGPRQTPMITVPGGKSQGPLQVMLRGGVAFCRSLSHVRDPEARSSGLTRAALASRPGNASSWQFMDGEGLTQAAALAVRPCNATQIGIRHAQSPTNVAPAASDSCIRTRFEIPTPLITNARIDDSTDPHEVILRGLGFGNDSTAQLVFNELPLKFRQWSKDKIVGLLPSPAAAGVLLVRVGNRDSNSVLLSLVPSSQRQEPPMLDIVNRTGSALNVAIESVIGLTAPKQLRVDPNASATLKVLPGGYRLTAQSTVDLHVTAPVTREDVYERGHRYTVTYESSTFPRGMFTINNNTGGEITLSFTGPVSKNLTVSTAGRSQFEISPGEYSVSVRAVCGTSNTQLHVETGTHHEATYSCEYHYVPR